MTELSKPCPNCHGKGRMYPEVARGVRKIDCPTCHDTGIEPSTPDPDELEPFNFEDDYRAE